MVINLVKQDFNNLIKIINQKSTDLEIMPLINIIFSTKMEINLKSSALSQIVLLIKTHKKVFCEELFPFLKSEILSIFLKFNKKFSFQNLKPLDFEYSGKMAND